MRNRQARFCSSRCRVYAHRAKLPRELIDRDRWVRHDERKRPLTSTGATASSTDSATWTNYGTARASLAGVGIGFVLGDGIGCIDLDHCLESGTPTPAASNFIAQHPGAYIEVSPSGDGLHIWGTLDPGPGSRRVENGLSVERYSTGRYITVTGRVYQAGTLLPL